MLIVISVFALFIVAAFAFSLMRVASWCDPDNQDVFDRGRS